jgi:hypothetical protein
MRIPVTGARFKDASATVLDNRDGWEPLPGPAPPERPEPAG